MEMNEHTQAIPETAFELATSQKFPSSRTFSVTYPDEFVERVGAPEGLNMHGAQNLYVVRIQENTFFAGFRGGNTAPLVTPFPSQALHLDYLEADRMCWFFRTKGYEETVACDILGAPVDAVTLQREQSLHELQNMPLADLKDKVRVQRNSASNRK
jgi:hypothetical protein